MIRRRVNGQGRGTHQLWAVLAFMLAPLMIACPTVHRYGPDEGESVTYRKQRLPKVRPVRVAPRTPTRKPRTFPAGSLAGQLGDGSMPSELVTGARRLIGFAFPERDTESFVDHLMAVALWEGERSPVTQPTAGDLWYGDGGRVAVVEASLAGGAFTVIGPQRDGVVARFEVRGTRFWRATSDDAEN